MTPAMEPPGPASRNAGACPDIFIVCERTRRGQRAGGRSNTSLFPEPVAVAVGPWRDRLHGAVAPCD